MKSGFGSSWASIPTWNSPSIAELGFLRCWIIELHVLNMGSHGFRGEVIVTIGSAECRLTKALLARNCVGVPGAASYRNMVPQWEIFQFRPSKRLLVVIGGCIYIIYILYVLLIALAFVDHQASLSVIHSSLILIDRPLGPLFATLTLEVIVAWSLPFSQIWFSSEFSIIEQ